LTAAHNAYVGMDPFLSSIDEKIIDPDQRVHRDEVIAVLRGLFEELKKHPDVADKTAQDALDEALRDADGDTPAEERAKENAGQTGRNFGRAVARRALTWLWTSVTGIPASVGKTVAKKIRKEMGEAAVEFLKDQEPAIRKLFEDNPAMSAILDAIFEALKK
jgi:hypothetical protein